MSTGPRYLKPKATEVAKIDATPQNIALEKQQREGQVKAFLEVQKPPQLIAYKSLEDLVQRLRESGGNYLKITNIFTSQFSTATKDLKSLEDAVDAAQRDIASKRQELNAATRKVNFATKQNKGQARANETEKKQDLTKATKTLENAVKALEEAKAENLDLLAQSESEAAIASKALIEKATKELINLFNEVIASERLQILMHEDNLNFLKTCGASNTIYSTPDRTKANPTERLKSVKVVLTKRQDSDGIGPFGGPLETYNKILSHFAFDVKKFNEGARDKSDDKQNTYSQSREMLYGLNREEGYEPSHTPAIVLLQKLFKAIEDVDQDTIKRLQQDINKFFDDLRIDNEGNLVEITNLNEIARNATEREMEDEATIASNATQQALINMLKNAINSRIIIGGVLDGDEVSQVIQLNPILREAFITREGFERIVSPIDMVTEVNLGDLEAFEAKFKEDASSGHVKHHCNQDISNLIITDLASLRRAGGVTKAFDKEVDLSVAVTKDKAIFGDFAYKFADEALVPIILTMLILHEVIPDKQEFHDFLVKQAEQDQKDVFIIDKRNHKLSLYSKALEMYITVLTSFISEELKQTIAYETMVDEIISHSPGLHGYVDRQLLQDIDSTYNNTHRNIEAMGGDAAAASIC